MEALDKLEARNAHRLDPNQVLRPAVADSFDDIKRLLTELDPALNKPQTNIPVSAVLTANEDGKSISYRVNAPTKSKSKRDMLIEGLDIVKKRLVSADQIAQLQESVEINGVEMKPAYLGYKSEGSTWVDPLIKQWLGAYRDGTMICWDLTDGYTYRYDIYNHKITRIETP